MCDYSSFSFIDKFPSARGAGGDAGPQPQPRAQAQAQAQPQQQRHHHTERRHLEWSRDTRGALVMRRWAGSEQDGGRGLSRWAGL